MTNSQLVEHTYRKHHTWLLQVSYNFTNSKDQSQELVQDLYLKLMEYKDITKIMFKDDVNLFYLYKMLRSIYLNGVKRLKPSLPLDDDLLNKPADEYSYEADNDFERMLVLTHEALNQEYWFGKKLLEVYINEGHSIQSLHDATGISNSTIWTQLNKTKKNIREYVKQKM